MGFLSPIFLLAGLAVAVPLMFGGPGVPAVLARGDRGDTPLPG